MDQYIISINRLQLNKLKEDFNKAMKDFPVRIEYTTTHRLLTVEVRVEVLGSESDLKAFEAWMKQFSAQRI
jgi:hypothetical protein